MLDSRQQFLDQRTRATAWAWSGARDQDAALNYLYCMLRARRWIHRRVDTLEIVDAQSSHRHISLDFSMPVNAPTVTLPNGVSMSALPLIQVGKRPIMRFDFRDSEGRDIPMLTARQSRSLSTLGILGFADKVLIGLGIPAGLTRNQEFLGVTGDSRVTHTLPPARKASREGALIQLAFLELVTASRVRRQQALSAFKTAGKDTPMGKIWADKRLRFTLEEMVTLDAGTKRDRDTRLRDLLDWGDNALGPKSDFRLTEDHPLAGVNGESRFDLTLAAGDDYGTSSPQYALIQSLLVQLVATDEEGGKAALDFFRCSPENSLAGRLWARMAFRIYLHRLAGDYYITGLFPNIQDSPKCRSVAIVEMQEYLGNSSLGNRDSSPKPRPIPTFLERAIRWSDRVIVASLSKVVQWLGLRPSQVYQAAHFAQDCESYHLEIVAPRGAKLVGAQVILQPPTGPENESATGSVNELRANTRSRVVADLGRHPVSVAPDIQRRAIEPTRMHLVLSPVPLGYNAWIEFRICATAGDWTLVALAALTMAYACIIPMTVGLLASTHSAISGGGILQHWAHSQNWGKATEESDELISTVLQNRATLIFGMAALAAAVLARSGEHAFTKRILIFPRVCAFVIVANLIFTGGVLVVGRPTLTSAFHWYYPISVYFAELSSVALVCILLSWLSSLGLARRLGRVSGLSRARLHPYWRVL